MRFIFLLFMLLGCFIGGQGYAQRLVLSGEIIGIDKGDVFLLVFFDGTQEKIARTDTIKINQKDCFRFDLLLKESDEALLVYCPGGMSLDINLDNCWSKPYKRLFLTPGEIFLKGKSQEIGLLDVSGGVYTGMARDYIREKDSLTYVLLCESGKWQDKEPGEAEYSRYRILQNQVQNRQLELLLDLVRQVPDSELAAFEYCDMLELVTNRYLKLSHSPYYQSNEDVEKVYYSFTPEIRQSKYGVRIKEFLGHHIRLREGKRAPQFVLKDLDGNWLRLSDLKGKCILLEFWDSNCEPCLQLIPEMKKLVRKYNPEKFCVLGISLDKEVDLCRKTLREHGVDWLQVCRGQWKENDQIDTQFLIGLLPTLVLIDERGRLVMYDGLLPEIEKWLDTHIK